ncbi:MAG: hypothetical protein HY077_10340 [Elusimicrobia bacterium]|nr:hypothetical protein [Elusimicrobiota bacterium]
MKFSLCLISLALITAGCSTIITKADKRWGVEYSGTKCATQRTKEIWKKTRVGGFMSSIDVALSAVADTLLWPADALMKKNSPPANPCPGG